MDEILGVVSASLSAPAPSTSVQSASLTGQPTLTEIVDPCEVEQGWEHDADDAEFDDLGEGVGVEGDLDMEDDN